MNNKTLADCQELVLQLMDKTIDPKSILINSKKIYLWQCPKNEEHIWKKDVRNRAVYNIGCPFCTGKKACKSSCLATLFPNIAKQWITEINGELTPYDVTPGSHKKIFWQCPKNKEHIWKTTVYERTKGLGCPYCSGQRACKDNCLTNLRPDIAKEWHTTKNSITPDQITCGSGKFFWWQCSRGHEWQATVTKRTGRGDNCPYCAGKKVCLDNCLATRFPELIKEWSSKNILTPYEVMPGTMKLYWWIGKCGHEWEMNIESRTGYHKMSCPYCTGKKICLDNCLATRFPEVALEWHPTKNNDKTPFDVFPGTPVKYWWLGKCGHEWKSSITGRTGVLGTNCPKCRHSKGEKKVEKYLTDNNISFITQFRFKDCKNQRSLPFDFYVNNKFLIEYQGEQHYGECRRKFKIDYEQLKKHDKIKKDFCTKNNIPLLEIPYWDFNNIEQIIDDFLRKIA